MRKFLELFEEILSARSEIFEQILTKLMGKILRKFRSNYENISDK